MIYTFTPDSLDDDHHVPLIRSRFTRDIGTGILVFSTTKLMAHRMLCSVAMYPSIRSEMDIAFQEYLPLPPDGSFH
jgi:hypothetical protein